jgi:hypothetical protein
LVWGTNRQKKKKNGKEKALVCENSRSLGAQKFSFLKLKERRWSQNIFVLIKTFLLSPKKGYHRGIQSLSDNKTYQREEQFTNLFFVASDFA